MKNKTKKNLENANELNLNKNVSTKDSNKNLCSESKANEKNIANKCEQSEVDIQNKQIDQNCKEFSEINDFQNVQDENTVQEPRGKKDVKGEQGDKDNKNDKVEPREEESQNEKGEQGQFDGQVHDKTKKKKFICFFTSLFKKRKKKNKQKKLSRYQMLKKILNILNEQEPKSREDSLTILREQELEIRQILETMITILKKQEELEREIRESLKTNFNKLDNQELKTPEMLKTSSQVEYSTKKQNNIINEQATNTLTAMYFIYLEMEKCENFDQVKMYIFKIKQLIEEYELLTGEKLSWRL